ncbi:MAG TPA: radical SAM protein [Candidatus Hydrogenedentes bacterium]|nr:radical SAM protein [Candidatus Hydrogenedentota bacterium]
MSSDRKTRSEEGASQHGNKTPQARRAAVKASLYGLGYILQHHFLGKTAPLIRGLVLTNRCNLRCEHCRVTDRGHRDLDFAEVVAAIDAFYREGGRCLYLEGGEPFLWHDGQNGLDDVVDYAHQLGFLTVVIYTNGTFPIRTSADTVFVSVDGLRETHDALRGESFDRIMGNIQGSGHPSLFINYTINSRNKDEIDAFCEYVHRIKQIRAVFFYFHTAYYGHDGLHIDTDEKRRILQALLSLRTRYRILNSRAGLLSASRNDWRRPLDVCSVYEKGVVYECCRYAGDPELCRDCGYLSYAEIDQTLKMKPSAIFSALKYF